MTGVIGFPRRPSPLPETIPTGLAESSILMDLVRPIRLPKRGLGFFP